MGRRLLFAFLALGFIFTTCTPAFAAGGLYGSLNGTVTDSSTHAPVAGAQVVAKSPTGTYSTRTDGRGFFSIVGMSVDTYTVTISEAKHETLNIPGVVVFGDQSNTVGTVAMTPLLKTIARVTSRSAASAFQPTQTTDQYTVNTQQMVMSTGNAAATNENSVLLAVPGVTLTNGMSVTIRGGAAAEVGFQYDGVPFKEPFLGQNASNGLMNAIGQVQVVEGAGDATQGEVGSGVINVIPRRGSGPGDGMFDAEMGGPNFNHQMSFNYGFSSANNRLSEYAAYVGQRFAPYYGYATTPLNQYGNTYATTYQTNDQFTNNFYYKFGHNLSQQFQVLYLNIQQQGYQGQTGCGGVYNQTTNPCAYAYYPYDTLTQASWTGLFSLFDPNPANAVNDYAALTGLTPGTPAYNKAITSPQQNFANQTTFLKFEYDNNLSSNTYLSLRYYNWHDLEDADGSYTLGPWGAGAPGVGFWERVGGQTTGGNLDLVHQFTPQLTVTLNGQYNVLKPYFDLYEPFLSIIQSFISSTEPFFDPTAANPGDWMAPGTNALGGPTGYLCGNNASGTNFLNCAPGANATTRIPSWGIGYHGTQFIDWGSGIRFQYNPNSKMKVDLGVRDEGQVRHWISQMDQFGQGVPATGCSDVAAIQAGQPCPAADVVAINNPFDVPSSLWSNEPTVIQPRGSISYQFGAYDALRVAYGRSAVFADAQTGGTPFALQGIEPFMNIPAKPGAVCGWAGSPFNTTVVFPCKSYGEQLYWQGDNVEAPDAENLPPAIYTNYDLSYNHLFKNGWGVRITPFFKLGTGLPTYYELNPVLGIFAISNQGYNKTTGLEFGVTTPTRAVGLSGFLTATYQNVLSTTPPFTSGETTVPTNSLATLALGDLYRAGYVSPFSLRLGATENFRNGLSVIPTIEFNVGYPYSVGNVMAACLVFSPTGTCLHYANVPQVDMAAGINPGQASLVGGAPGASINTNYYDPAYPGSVGNPNIAATRGTPGTAANGGILSHSNLYGNLTLQYTHNKDTVGVQMFNLFGNAWMNSVPIVNPWYQPVANGVSGPQTGYNSCVNQTGANIRGCYPTVPTESYAYSNGAYLLSNGNFSGGLTYGPVQPFTIQLFYQRRL